MTGQPLRAQNKSPIAESVRVSGRNSCKPWLLVLFVAFCCRGLAAAQNQPMPWWYTLEQGKRLFRNGDYGNALLVFDDARRQRRAMYERMEGDLIVLLSLGEVRRLGDSLDWVDRYARERHYAGAVEALEELYYRIPRDRFNNSAEAALSALGNLKNYPEAEYWIGETYRVEGELGLALGQFQKAYDMRGLLENQGFGIELLYKIADVRKTRQEYNEMERMLLSIIAGDTLWTNANSGDQKAVLPDGEKGAVPYAEASASFARQAMTRTLETDGVTRFLTQFRYNNPQTEAAHRLLGFFYYTSGRHGKAQEHLMFAFLIQNTVIIEEVARNQFDFTFTTLDNLSVEINRYPALVDYVEKVNYYQTAYYLGTSLYGNGKTDAARGFWEWLAAQPRAGEWRNRARGQLSRPHVERAVEMP
jgi:tetratricopeptide (TPR) repeat protein